MKGRSAWAVVAVAFVALALCAGAANATTDETGNTAIAQDLCQAVAANGAMVNASGTGTLQTVCINFNTSTGGGNVQLGIYNASGNTPFNKARLAEATTAVAVGWVCVNLSASNINITSGSTYLLAYFTSITDNKQYHTGGLGGRQAYPVGSLPATWTPDSGDIPFWANMRMTYILNIGPQYSANSTKYATPTAFNTSATYGFQIDWDGAGGFFNTTNVTFEANFTGTMSNYTNATSPALFNRSASTFVINFTNFNFANATHFEYRWRAVNGTGTDAVNNNTAWMSYDIAKVPTALHVALNGTEADGTYVYNSIPNASAWTDVAGLQPQFTRNGTVISSPSYGNLSAHAYNFTATLSGGNYSAAAVMRYLTVNKAATTTAIAFSPSATVAENTPITATATSNVSYVFYKDGVIIASPYSATLPFGIYNFTIGQADIENYTGGVTTSFLTVTSGGFGCTDRDTYAFQKLFTGMKNASTLNFTDEYNAGFVKWDLSDVWLNTSNMTALRNQSNGDYYMTVNSTNATQFYVKFGNFIGNRSYANVTNSTGSIVNMTDVGGYSEINPYVMLTFYDELTGVQQLPPATNRTLSLFCSNGVSSYGTNASKVLAAAFNQLSQVKMTVSYSATETYYRSLLVSNAVEYKNFYLVDANLNQVAQLELSISDECATYRQGDILAIKKTLEGTLQTITEARLDAEMKTIDYLINADNYQLYLDNGATVSTIGNLYIDPTDLTKTINIPCTLAGVAANAWNVSYSLTMTNGTITLNYIDGANLTNNVSLWVYDSTGASLLFFGSSTNRSIISLNYVTPDENATYKVHYTFDRTDYTQWDIWSWLAGNPANIATDVGGLPIDPTYLMFASLLFIVIVPMMFGPLHGATAGVVMVLLASVLLYYRFYTISLTVLALAGVLAMLNALARKRGE